VFLQVADEHRTISAFELQELLEGCLPNGMDESAEKIVLVVLLSKDM